MDWTFQILSILKIMIRIILPSGSSPNGRKDGLYLIRKGKDDSESQYPDQSTETSLDSSLFGNLSEV